MTCGNALGILFIVNDKWKWSKGRYPHAQAKDSILIVLS